MKRSGKKRDESTSLPSIDEKGRLNHFVSRIQAESIVRWEREGELEKETEIGFITSPDFILFSFREAKSGVNKRNCVTSTKVRMLFLSFLSFSSLANDTQPPKGRKPFHNLHLSPAFCIPAQQYSRVPPYTRTQYCICTPIIHVIHSFQVLLCALQTSFRSLPRHSQFNRKKKRKEEHTNSVWETWKVEEEKRSFSQVKSSLRMEQERDEWEINRSFNIDNESFKYFV